MKKKFSLLVLSLLLVLTACGGGAKNNAPAANSGANNKAAETTEGNTATENTEAEKVVIGVSPTPHGEIIEELMPKFAEAGIELEVVNFDDYVQPNLQLDSGDLDVNYFQHKPYLDSFNSEHGTKLVSVGNVHIEPIGLYSKKITSLDELKEGDEIIIPNDPSNGARSLLLLEKNGVIKLKDPTDPLATEADITENPKNIKFVPVEAQNIPTVYEEAAAAVINSNYAILAGLDPITDSIVIEDKESPYANVVAAKEGRENEEKIKKVYEILTSEEAKKFIEEKYKGAVVPAF